MKTLEIIRAGGLVVPMRISWYLSELGHARGLQDLHSRQAPQRLKVLREHAVAQSAVSSNRIEGVEIDRARVGTVVFGRRALRDRGEQEVRGYRQALDWVHTRAARLPITQATIRRLHRMCRPDLWDAGRYKNKPIDIIERQADGSQRVRFRSVPPAETPACMARLVALWNELARERTVSPLVLLAAFNLDFLCIHPFRDGNGRVSRLLLLLTGYHTGLEVGRYISLERLIEEHKARYYETLGISSQGWHTGKHDPWSYISFLLFILKQAYDEFERRVGDWVSPRGAKTEIVRQALAGLPAAFTLGQLERACPGVSRDMVRKVLKDLKAAGRVRCRGRGPGARWEKR